MAESQWPCYSSAWLTMTEAAFELDKGLPIVRSTLSSIAAHDRGQRDRTCLVVEWSECDSRSCKHPEFFTEIIDATDPWIGKSIH